MTDVAAVTAAKPAAARALRPRDAATMILFDLSSSEPKVLLGRRNERQVFMPGKYVFPGGRIDPCDRRMNVFGSLPPHVERQLLIRVQRPSPIKARALALAAIRELAEETGLLLGSREAGAPVAPTADWLMFEQAGVYPTLDNLHLIARAITPPGRVRRFDTRFFAADASQIAATIEGVTGPDAELTELVWAPIGEARMLDLPRVVSFALDHLQERLDQGLERDAPLPFYYQKGATFCCEKL